MRTMAHVTAAAAAGVLLLVAEPRAAAQDERTGQVPAAAPPPTETVQPSQWQMGIGTMACTAAGEFSAHIDNAGGLLIQMERRFGPVFSLGGETSLLWYGHDTHEVALAVSFRTRQTQR